ncbi:class I SAM-dependent methyltransferase [Neobacillus muris]|uniref:class I SAM-dependent methyltransferase n=1 Tax=Neobacillus muris TaxID=2941334 RepID=UPI00203D2810|nr:class I SAM-dependent methyltransferase [Neobacillus muris]
MGIDFHNKKNRNTYSSRSADFSWINAIKELLPIENISIAADIGCGGGIYTKALSDMGILSVTGVDFSEAILDGARENGKEYTNIMFKQGNAYCSGLTSSRYDLLLERALIHHLDDLHQCFKEANRILKDKGYLIVQDRTPEDCLVKGSESHIRGYFFEQFPELIEKETRRRHSSQVVVEALKEAGFRDIQEVTLWETRKVYETKEQLQTDLLERTGRSILHELTDKELLELVRVIGHSISANSTIVEKDRWTIWKAVK